MLNNSITNSAAQIAALSKEKRERDKHHHQAQHQGCGNDSQQQGCEAKELTEEEFKAATLSGAILSAIANSGVSATCIKETQDTLTSECGRYRWTPKPYQPTNKKSDKMFIMGTGDCAPAADEIIVDLPLRKETRESHTVGGAESQPSQPGPHGAARVHRKF